MSDTFPARFQAVIQAPSQSSQRTGRPLYGIPFTQAQEYALACAIRNVIEEDKRIFTDDTLKSFIVQAAQKFNVYLNPTEHYDVWLKQFFIRHPDVSLAINPNQKLTLGDQRERLDELIAIQQAQTSTSNVIPNISTNKLTATQELKPKYNIPDDDLHNWIADKSKEIFYWKRASTNQLNKCPTLYANYFFNYLGYVAGFFVGTSTPESHISGNINYTIRRNHTRKYIEGMTYLRAPQTNPSGCSFTQEMKDGLRIHPEKAFSINIRSTTSSISEQLRNPTRNVMEALASKIKYFPDEIMSVEFLDILRRKIRLEFPQDFDWPWDPRPLQKTVFPFTHFFQYTKQEDVRHHAHDLFNHYIAMCRTYNYVTEFVYANMFMYRLRKHVLRIESNLDPTSKLLIYTNLRLITTQF